MTLASVFAMLAMVAHELSIVYIIYFGRGDGEALLRCD